MIKKDFKKLLQKYMDIKGLDIIVYLNNGLVIELQKNRSLVKDEIVVWDKISGEIRIHLSEIKSVELYAA